ncbi:MAG: CpXC domain-containing protein [Elusimicrobia bacterium]|nr:CpXC domain-containing protein [Elusimicrobiota bacterium]
MSLTVFEEVKCPCGETFRTEVVSSINVQQNPEMRDLLLGGEINILKCPACGDFFYVEHFILYIDTPNELIAFVYPGENEKDRETYEMKMLEDFVTAQDALEPGQKINYTPVLIFGLDSLVDLLNYEDRRKDEVDVVKFVCKTNSIDQIKLKIAQAREVNLPEVLPSFGGLTNTEKISKEAVIAGINKVLALSPGLKIYKEILKRIAGETDWDIKKLLKVA